MKLTKNETKALTELSKRGVNMCFMRATVCKLVERGLARRTTGVIGWAPQFIITDAGRAALAASKEEAE